ncbi:hypothetical protein [Streptomyces sp. cg40]|uniref:hypothetical protein n=1 Tax=Streptomyces sp. cg40 TaxID=3419764 RepID=UPI003D05207A
MTSARARATAVLSAVSYIEAALASTAHCTPLSLNPPRAPKHGTGAQQGASEGRAA